MKTSDNLHNYDKNAKGIVVLYKAENEQNVLTGEGGREKKTKTTTTISVIRKNGEGTKCLRQK